MANLLGRIDKKQILLEREQSILKEIKYYEKRIEDAKNAKRDTPCYESDSSESDFEFTIENEPSIVELMQQQKMLKTCLLATEELTNVSVVQSEVNILPNDPVLEGEPPVSEEGVWKEVIAECRIGVVPFSINFFAHQAKRPFAPISYRNLQVLLVKKSHGVELSKSVLPQLKRPADAIEVIRSYADAFRSRRTTLAKLAEKYADSLFMEPKAEGGYILKCANILEISWTLENKYSPLARFQHRMTIDLDYIDESYLRIIDKANKQLSNPSIQTENRTLLLCTIIDTCLKAQGITNGSHNSETESEKLKPTTSNEQQNTLDVNLMAPPKSIPKKTKKNKEIAKRPNTDTDDANSKKPKTNNNILKTTEKSNTENKKLTDGVQNKKPKTTNNVASDKNVQNDVENKKRAVETTEKEQNKRAKTVLNENDSGGKTKNKNAEDVLKSNLGSKKGNTQIKNSKEVASAKKVDQNSKVTQASETHIEKPKKNITENLNGNINKNQINEKNNASTTKVVEKNKNKERNTILVSNSKIQPGHTEIGKNSSQKNKENITNNKLNANDENNIQKIPKEKALKKVTEKPSNNPITSKKTVENVASKHINKNHKAPNLNKQTKNLQHSNEKNKVNKVIKSVVSEENSKYVKRNSFSSKIKLLNTQKKRKLIGFTSNIHDANIKSKIPQKKFPIAPEGSLKKNALRISPRKMATQIKTVKSQMSMKTLKPTSIPVAKRVY